MPPKAERNGLSDQLKFEYIDAHPTPPTPPSKLGKAVQPYEHCPSSYFPAVAETFGFQLVQPSPAWTAFPHSSSRGPQCEWFDQEKRMWKKDGTCHRDHLPSFVYTHPKLVCANATAHNSITAITRYTVSSDSTTCVIQACYWCFLKSKTAKPCSIGSHKLHAALNPANRTGIPYSAPIRHRRDQTTPGLSETEQSLESEEVAPSAQPPKRVAQSPPPSSRSRNKRRAAGQLPITPSPAGIAPQAPTPFITGSRTPVAETLKKGKGKEREAVSPTPTPLSESFPGTITLAKVIAADSSALVLRLRSLESYAVDHEQERSHLLKQLSQAKRSLAVSEDANRRLNTMLTTTRRTKDELQKQVDRLDKRIAEAVSDQKARADDLASEVTFVNERWAKAVSERDAAVDERIQLELDVDKMNRVRVAADQQQARPVPGSKQRGSM